MTTTNDSSSDVTSDETLVADETHVADETLEAAETDTSTSDSSETKSGETQDAAAKEGVTPQYNQRQQYEVIEAPAITLKSLLDAGAHFGHQSHRWNPRMLKYIFGEKNGTHIINLDITLDLWKKAEKFLEDIANRGGNILFVGTKPQARELARTAAERVGGFSVTQRWLGGTLSNFETIKRSINRMRKLEDLLSKAEVEGSTVRLNKKERLGIRRELEKLESNLGGIRNMRHIPDVLFVIDVQREAIAVREARKLHIPVVALVDSNVDPSQIDYPIPSNDDASKTLRLFIDNVAAAFSRGRHAFFSRGPERHEGGRGARHSSADVEVVTKKGASQDKDKDEAASLAASA